MNKHLKEYTDKFTDFKRKAIADFILYNAGIEYCDPGYNYGPKRREYHFIHFVKEGKGKLYINGETFSVKENELFIVPENTISQYIADDKDPWKYSWIGFLGIEANNFIQTLIKSSGGKYVYNCQNAAFYEHLIEEILEDKNRNYASYFLINGLLYYMIGKISEDLNIIRGLSEEYTITSEVIRYMDVHYHEDLQISDIANAINIHPNYLSNVFYKEMGYSPKKYLSNLKLAKAKKLLTETDDPIYIVASSVGFSDALYFSRFFKSAEGISPSIFRKENKK